MTPHEMGYTGPDAYAMMTRDHALCKCNHKNLSHGSNENGIGRAACGFCNCEHFEAPHVPEDLDERFTVSAGKHDLNRAEAMEAANQTPHRLWTIIEGEDCDCEIDDDDEEGCGHETEWYASPGYHYVNALNWILTDEEWAAGDEKTDFIYNGHGA